MATRRRGAPPTPPAPKRKKSSGALVYLLQDPREVARSVVTNYVSKARENVTTWGDSYRANILAYTGDEAKQSHAIDKLGVWYNIYVTDVYPTVKETFATARSKYIRRVAEERRRVVTGAG